MNNCKKYCKMFYENKKWFFFDMKILKILYLKINKRVIGNLIYIYIGMGILVCMYC